MEPRWIDYLPKREDKQARIEKNKKKEKAKAIRDHKAALIAELHGDIFAAASKRA